MCRFCPDCQGGRPGFSIAAAKVLGLNRALTNGGYDGAEPPPRTRPRFMLMSSAAHPRFALPFSADSFGRAAELPPTLLDWLGRGRQERLVLFLPMLTLPTVAGWRDLLLLGALLLLVTAIERALEPPRPSDRTGLAIAGLAWLLAGLVFGTGAALTLALFALARSIEQRLPEALWPIRLGLTGLAAALLVDLALIALALERSSLWLALAATIGTATAAARHLDDHAAEPRIYLEAALIAAGCLVLALYAALLAHEPALDQLADAGRFLALPLLAAAVVRLGWLALEPGRRRRADPLAIGLLAAWALAGLALGGAASLA